MSDDIVINAENLSKKYRIGVTATPSSIRDFIDDFIHHPLGSNKPKSHQLDFWALKNLSFNVKKGQVIGIIGKNGSGKSTLLKILSRIVAPTEGKATLQGRVASLLEVGTGFNPELTGRENIFLNGAILGMSKKEIARKFDEIVAFSGVDKFINTPVKRYSSGMYVRLAFAIAAHLDADILLVDEVLAVGDAEFQKKCLGKMKNLADGGRTVLFVSHDMRTMRNLCDTCMLMSDGKIEKIGEASSVINHYEHMVNTQKLDKPLYAAKKSGSYIAKINFSTDTQTHTQSVPVCDDFFIEIEVQVNTPIDNAALTISFIKDLQTVLFITDSDSTGRFSRYEKGAHLFTVTVPKFLLNFGEYLIEVRLQQPYVEVHDNVTDLYLQIFDQNNPRSKLYRGASVGLSGIMLPLKRKLLAS